MKRPAVWAAIFIICGIYFRLGMSIMICLVFFILILSTTAYFVIKTKNKAYILFVLFVIAGFLVAENKAKSDIDEYQFNKTVEAEGMVMSRSVSSNGYQKLKVRVDDFTGGGETIFIYMIVSRENEVRIGDHIVFSGELLPLESSGVPGGYDERKYLLSQGISGKVFPDTIVIMEHKTTLHSVIFGVKDALYKRIIQIFPEEEVGVVMAMLTGDRDYLLDETKQLYNQAGVMHILCISGLHISFFALYVGKLFEEFLRLGRRKSAGLVLMVMLMFLLFTGFSASAVRATTMVAIGLIGKIVFRKGEWLNGIAIAAIVLLIAQPWYLWLAGFQLSFVTVIGIWAASRLFVEGNDWQAKVTNTCIVSLFASLFSLPIVAYHFYWISISGVLVNLFVVPLCGILLICCLISGIMSIVYLPLAQFAGGSVYIILSFYRESALLASKLPFAYVLVGRPSDLFLISYFVLLMGICFYGTKCWNKKTLAVTFGIFICVCGANRFVFRQNTIAFLDVGQGDAIVITTYDKRCIIIDGGGIVYRAFGNNTGVRVVKPYLEYMGIKNPDAVMITHFDADHCIGALEIIAETNPKAVYISAYPTHKSIYWEQLKELMENREILLYTVNQGDRFVWSDAEWLECVSPQEGIVFDDGDENHASLGLRYAYGGVKVLFTGDMSISDEWRLLAQDLDIRSDIIKIGHHGSRYSTGSEFLATVMPEIAIVSSGENNRYGHPHEEVLERLEAANIPLYRTNEAGTISVHLSPSGEYSLSGVREGKTVYERITAAVGKS